MALDESEYGPEIFIKGSESNEANTVVFVGNGAIRGGWDPLRFAVDDWLSKEKDVVRAVTNLRRQNSETFHQLALQSYKFKLSRAQEFISWIKNTQGDTRCPSIVQSAQVGLPRFVQNFLQLRNNIGEAFCSKAAHLKLKSTPEIEKILGADPHFVTSNWDQTLWIDSAIKNLVHIHGRCEYSDSLIMPTDLIIEDISHDIAPLRKLDLSNLSKDFLRDVSSMLRVKYSRALLSAHLKTTKLLAKTSRIIIWGYSLSDYDADVSALLSSMAPEKKSTIELTVINPDSAAFFRAIALTGITNAIHFNPLTETYVKFDCRV